MGSYDDLVDWKHVRGSLSKRKPLKVSWEHDPYTDKSGDGYCDSLAGLRFNPDRCDLEDFEVTDFLNKIAGRRLALLGCSMTRQFFHYLAGRLQDHRLPGETHKLDYGRLHYKVNGCSRKGAYSVSTVLNYTKFPKRYPSGLHGVDFLTTSCFSAVYPEKRFCYTYKVPVSDELAKLCYIYASQDVLNDHNIAAYNALGPRDILLANTGVHFNEKVQLLGSMFPFVKILQTAKHARDARPIVIWRESSAQHFNVVPGGYWPPQKHIRERAKLKHVNKKFRCKSQPMKVVVAKDWRNFMTKKILHELRLPVLPIHTPTIPAAQFHPQTLRGGTMADCTHFCPTAGGMYEIWSEFLNTVLSTVLKKEKKVKADPSLAADKHMSIFWRLAV